LLAAAEWKESQAEKQAKSIDSATGGSSILIIFYACQKSAAGGLIICLLSRCLLAQFNPGLFSRCGSHNTRTGYPPSTLGVFTAHKMTTTGPSVPDLAGSCNLNSFAQPLMSLLFRHF